MKVIKMDYKEIAKNQTEHWERLAVKHAGTVSAVGGESMKHKYLRYGKILKLVEADNNFTIHEIGPGVGDLLDFLQHNKSNSNYTYSASEITEEYCKIMRQQYPEVDVFYRNILTENVSEKYDYVILSGVFHQQGNVGHRDWEFYMKGLLQEAWNMALKGIAFNIITADADYYKPGNYYADIFELQQYIIRNYSRFFQIDKSYPLFEATFFIYKADHIKKLYPQSQFQKYLDRE